MNETTDHSCTECFADCPECREERKLPRTAKVIEIPSCSQCPHFSGDFGGNKPHCNHHKIQVVFPYAISRIVDPLTIPVWCPLENADV